MVVEVGPYMKRKIFKLARRKSRSKNEVSPMARRRFGFRKFRRASRSAYRSVKRYSRRSRIGGGVTPLHFDAMAYGAIRPYAAGLVSPLTSVVAGVVPGGIADELALGAVNYFVAKNTSGMVRSIATKGLIIENARVGEAAGAMLLGGASTSSGSGYTYG